MYPNYFYLWLGAEMLFTKAHWDILKNFINDILRCVIGWNFGGFFTLVYYVVIHGPRPILIQSLEY